MLIFSGLLSAFSLPTENGTGLSLRGNAQVVYMMAGTVLAAGTILAAIRSPHPGQFSLCVTIPLRVHPCRRRWMSRH